MAMVWSLGSGGGGSFWRLPVDLAGTAEICVHTAVMSRKEMRQESRSMNGTRFSSASRAFLPFLFGVTGAAPDIACL